GGPWLWRVRILSGLMAVVVPSPLRVSSQPHLWMTMRWWKGHISARFHRAVGPPRERGRMWGIWQAFGRCRHPGQARRRARGGRRRRGWGGWWGGVVRVSRGGRPGPPSAAGIRLRSLLLPLPGWPCRFRLPSPASLLLLLLLPPPLLRLLPLLLPLVLRPGRR